MSHEVSLQVFDDDFLCPAAAYDLPLATGTDLKCASLLSALWLLLCRLLQRDYEGAAKLLPFVSVASAEGHLRSDEKRVFRMALTDTSDRSPDAVATWHERFFTLNTCFRRPAAVLGGALETCARCRGPGPAR